MSGATANSYDELPYKGAFIPMTHPDRMATMAILHGMTPTPVGRCRVLELGCCDGGNLLTIAQTLPGASLLGIDLSTRQVDEGRAMIEAVGAENVELRALDLMEFDDSFGRFDYILCHGVYSWVPAPVRDKILQICKRHLAPDGVAYVSYNTLPGWGLRGTVRDLMCYHTRGIADPTARVQQARAALDFIASTATPQDGPYARYLREEIKKYEKFADAYIFHEFLEEEVHPVYFHEFAAHAESAGLRYVSHATLSIEEVTLPEDFRRVVGQLGSDLIRREQYIDFALNRPFRQSLLCHSGVMTFDRPVPEAVRSLRIAALARPEKPDPDLASSDRESFVTMFGDRRTADEPLIKAALVALYRLWPRSTDVEGLWASCVDLLGWSESSAGANRDQFLPMLLRCHLLQLVDFHTTDPPIAAVPGERPRAGALARHQAARNERLVSLRNHVTPIQEIDRLVLPLLDGSRDRAEIVREMALAVEAGKLKLQSDGEPITDPGAVREALRSIVPASLGRLAGAALLIGD
ncbi:MAG: class I SAM-dependent methyltransferase [Isosphaeraceae bacterium]